LLSSNLLIYIKGGQLVFHWDRLENLLKTRDRPLGNKVTSTKCKMQCFSFLCSFWNIDWKMFFLSILSIQCEIRCDRPSDTQQSTSSINVLATLIYMYSHKHLLYTCSAVLLWMLWTELDGGMQQHTIKYKFWKTHVGQKACFMDPWLRCQLLLVSWCP